MTNLANRKKNVKKIQHANKISISKHLQQPNVKYANILVINISIFTLYVLLKINSYYIMFISFNEIYIISIDHSVYCIFWNVRVFCISLKFIITSEQRWIFKKWLQQVLHNYPYFICTKFQLNWFSSIVYMRMYCHTLLHLLWETLASTSEADISKSQY